MEKVISGSKMAICHHRSSYPNVPQREVVKYEMCQAEVPTARVEQQPPGRPRKPKAAQMPWFAWAGAVFA